MLHKRYLSLSTEIEETISYKYPIVKCNKGCCYYARKLFSWCSHLECSHSCLNVSYFCEFYSWDYDWAKVYCIVFYCMILLIIVFATVLQIPLMYQAWEEITKLCLHNSLYHMSTSFVALQFDEEWNIIRLLKISIDDYISGF